MNNSKTNVLVIGLLATGSSAIIDLLREYENVHIIPGEFNDYRAPGLVADQLLVNEPNDYQNKISELTGFKNKLNLIYSIFPVFQFSSGIFHGFQDRLKYSLTRIRQVTILGELNKKLSTGISTDEKINCAIQWIKNVSKIFNQKKLVVFNQPFLPANDIDTWKRVFAPLKLIVVYRNPFDQFTDIVQRGNLMAPYNAPFLSMGSVILETIYGRSRKSAFKFHIDAMKKRNEWVNTLKTNLNDDELMLIDFEDISQNNDKYREKLQKFLGLNGLQHTKKGKFFDKNRAKNSVNIYKEILSEDEVSMLSDLNMWYLNFKCK